MKIGFDISQTGQAKAGCGFFAENLIHHLAEIDTDNHYTLYSTFGNHFWDKAFNSTCDIKQPNFQNGLKQSSDRHAKRFWQTSVEKIEKKLGNVDILHSNNFFCPPKFDHTRLVYSLYDLSFLEHPDCTTEHNRTACFDGVFKASLNADFIVAISNYTRQHFLNTFPHYPANRIIVAHLASRFNSNVLVLHKPPKLEKIQSQQYWLNVGTIEPRKNITRLLEAYAKLRARQPHTYPLVLAGKRGWLQDNINKTIEQLNLKPFVHILGYVDNNELQWLYQNCFCLVYPSLFEGFGLPVLEAMSFGAPVITSNASSLPEVAGNAGILVNPTDEDEILQAMIEMMTNDNQRNQLKALSLKQASLFSWHNTAKTVLNVYKEVITLPKYDKLNSFINMALS